MSMSRVKEVKLLKKEQEKWVRVLVQAPTLPSHGDLVITLSYLINTERAADIN